MEVSSCEIETKFKFKINLDLTGFDKHYKVVEEKPHLSFRKDFVATFKNGNQFNGYIFFADQNPRCKALYIIMAEKDFDMKELISKFDFQINGVRKRGIGKGNEIKFIGNDYASYGPTITLNDIEGKISTCNGFIELEFQPTFRVVRKEELKR